MSGKDDRPGDLLPADEGVLIAHRKLLALLLADLAGRGGDALAAVDAIERRLGYDDHHEDPGVEPDPAFAIERRADGELRRILRDVRAMLAANDRPASGPLDAQDLE